ncbi:MULTISPECIES: hypothetical protein [Bacillus]|uniref:hypothetical protein n=1 Tax=Bacillus TaxID=1386 RepID=UPI00034AC315|nr:MULTISPECIES: hypothetical protein [Bacillus]ARV98196.1 hypothetical protein S101444_01348 [Bacillus subtilis subsp. subtilis]ARW02274.1 hypothetical protein S100757_01343 [Bacillus subtilis subsp. subtilis]ASB56679.1 hypothetical protein S100761_01350 [Bacillus subtilis subsp. subtilis]ASB69260.1 hypothetical protein S100333_01367 [Bacillus subtilis subsp. subtilis]ASZ60934.1 hypothetical protein CLD04_07065 [Bacillus subtilis]
MKIKYSIVSLLLSLFTFFLLQVADRLKDVILTASTVDTDESMIDQSLLESSLVIIPTIFLILSVVFYYTLPKEK